MVLSSRYMVGSGVVATGYLFAALLKKAGFSYFDALDYGMLVGVAIFIALFVSFAGYVLWKTFFGPDHPA